MVKKQQRNVPNRGDILWLNFSPHCGREQGGRRPAVVMSPESYNGRTGMAIVCPMTTKQKGYAGEVLCMFSGRQGFVLSDQVKCLDWRNRSCEIVDHASDEVVFLIRERIQALLEDE